MVCCCCGWLLWVCQALSIVLFCLFCRLFVAPCRSTTHSLNPLSVTTPRPTNEPTTQVKFQTLVCVDTEQRCTGVVAIGDLVAYFID